MNFKTVFDLTTASVDFFYGPLSIVYLILPVGVGIIILYNRNRKRGNTKTKYLLMGIGFIFISTMLILFFLVSQFLDIRKAKKIMQSGNFSIVEGQPENYHAMPKEGHDMERFDINGIHFAYSDFVLNEPGYHNAASLGGVIVPNKYYRLTYCTLHDDIDSNRIIKIEIRE